MLFRVTKKVKLLRNASVAIRVSMPPLDSGMADFKSCKMWISAGVGGIFTPDRESR
mgnify:CR=1 FL=1